MGNCLTQIDDFYKLIEYYYVRTYKETKLPINLPEINK